MTEEKNDTETMDPFVLQLKEKTGQVKIIDQHIVINNGEGKETDVLLSVCNTPEEILAWSIGLAGKSWITPFMIKLFVLRAAEFHGIELPIGRFDIEGSLLDNL